MEMQINFTKNPRLDIYEKILNTSEDLFSLVKKAPANLRVGLPAILQNNNFGISLLVTKEYAFLEVTNKFRARKEKNKERLKSYQELFVPLTTPEKICYAISDARLCGISRVGLENGRAFAIGHDFSLYISEVISLCFDGDKRMLNEIDLLYVVGFGEKIREEDAWQEFDALIRVSLERWGKK